MGKNRSWPKKKNQIKTTQHTDRLLRCGHTQMQRRQMRTESRCEEVSQSDRTVSEGESESCERVKSAATAAALLWYLAPFRQSGRRIFPRAAWPSDGAKSHTERAKGVWGSKRGGHQTFQSQRVSQTPQTIKTRWPPLSQPTQPLKTTLHSISRVCPTTEGSSSRHYSLTLPKMSRHEHDGTGTHTHWGIITLGCRFTSAFQLSALLNNKLKTPPVFWEAPGLLSLS